MCNALKSEFLKQKRRFPLKLLWAAPLVPLLLALLLMGGCFLLEGSFNWWYTMLLPGALAMLISFTISAEKKHNRHGLFSVFADKKKLWFAQLVLHTLFLFLMNLIFFVLVCAAGVFLGIPMPFFDIFTAILVLSVTFAWQIPLFMFLGEKAGALCLIFVSLLFNMGFGIFFAATKLWYIPFSIPARLMCPILRVLPNGLPVPAGSSFENASVIFPGLLITVLLYIVLSLVTAGWFARKEV